MDPIDICPPWWPWPFPKPGPWPPPPWWGRMGDPGELVKIPADGLLALDAFRLLTIYSMSYQVQDRGLQAGMRAFALEQLQGRVEAMERRSK